MSGKKAPDYVKVMSSGLSWHGLGDFKFIIESLLYKLILPILVAKSQAITWPLLL